MKKYFILAAAALSFAACSSDDEVAPKQEAQSEQAIAFNAYVGRGTTRAGAAGELVTSSPATGQIDLQTKGFGVFSYYTDNVPYSETATPNFMYNQKVSYDGANWSYDPLKYWPNEFGGTAISDGEDRLTFFAYAPYVAVTPGTGRVSEGSTTSGIVGLTSNVSTGDPYVKYYVDLDPDQCVDLCWGVAKSVFNSTVTGATANNIALGAPYINVIKPTISSKIDFDFKHALAALNVQIDTDVDLSNHSHGTALDSKTKIYVRSVTFEGFASKGLLNLNAKASEGPLWFDLNSTNTKISSTSVTIYDGRRDGKEGQANATASNETPSNLNPNIIQTEAGTETGVTNDGYNLFNSNVKARPIYVIPTGDALKVTIVYDVETEDDNLSTYLSDGKTKGSTVQNAITKNIVFSTGYTPAIMEAGKKYTVTLHLGVTSVKFDASVTEWVNGGGIEPTDVPVNN